MMNNGVFFSGISFLLAEIFKCFFFFFSKPDDAPYRLSPKINHKIKNISGNIGVMLLKLGTSNVPQVRHKMTPTVCCCHGNHLTFGCYTFSCLIDVLSFVLIRRRLLSMLWRGHVVQYICVIDQA